MSDFLGWFNPTRWLILAVVVASLASAGGLVLHHYGNGRYEAGKAEVTAKWMAERAALKDQVQAQRDKNLELQRAAEKRYVVQGEIRDHYITQTITEVRHETANLAACVLTPVARSLLNDAGRCASEDSAAACGADGKVPDAATAH
jgi:hypothetical protein